MYTAHVMQAAKQEPTQKRMFSQYVVNSVQCWGWRVILIV